MAPTVPSLPSPKKSARTPSRLGREGRVDGEARVRDVVDDADREVAPRRRARELVEHRLRHRRRELLRREPVAAADDARQRAAVRGRVDERGDDVLVERLARRAGLLGAVEHGDRARRSPAAPRASAAAGNGR